MLTICINRPGAQDIRCRSADRSAGPLVELRDESLGRHQAEGVFDYRCDFAPVDCGVTTRVEVHADALSEDADALGIGLTNRSGSAAPSSSCTPAGEGHHIDTRLSLAKSWSWRWQIGRLSRTKEPGAPWPSRSLTSGSARAIARTRSSALFVTTTSFTPIPKARESALRTTLHGLRPGSRAPTWVLTRRSGRGSPLGSCPS